MLFRSCFVEEARLLAFELNEEDLFKGKAFARGLRMLLFARGMNKNERGGEGGKVVAFEDVLGDRVDEVVEDATREEFLDLVVDPGGGDSFRLGVDGEESRVRLESCVGKEGACDFARHRGDFFQSPGLQE